MLNVARRIILAVLCEAWLNRSAVSGTEAGCAASERLIYVMSYYLSLIGRLRVQGWAFTLSVSRIRAEPSTGQHLQQTWCATGLAVPWK